MFERDRTTVMPSAAYLEPCGFTRAEARRAASYQPGQVVTVRKGGRGKPRPGIGYRVSSAVRSTGAQLSTCFDEVGTQRQ